MPMASINDTELHYAVEGDGIPCFVPSTAGSDFYQHAFSDELRRRVQLIFVDVRGTGRSAPLPPERITLDLLLDDLDTLRQQLGFERVAMLGHSRHGFFPLAFARAYPEAISHAVLVGALPAGGPAWIERVIAHWRETAPPERQALMERTMAALPKEERVAPATAEGFIRQYLARAPLFWNDPHFDAAPLWEGTQLNVAGANRCLEIIAENDLTPSFGDVRTPVLLLLGRDDYSAPPALWEGEWEKFPDCTRVVFERSGHGPMFEEQAAFDAALADWLALRGDAR